MQTETRAAQHVPGDVNHKFLALAGHDFCSTCGESLRGKRTALETEMLEALEALFDCEALEMCRRDDNPERDAPGVAKARAAIQKARGEK